MPKLWLALFIGYNGLNFSGMQFQLQDHVSTVENLMAERLHACGFLTTTHYGVLEKQDKWSRAARTDKGVHAVLNCVSCLFTIDKNYFDDDNILNRNHLHLDLKECFEGTDIVYHGFRRLTNRSEVRHIVRSRHYCYICPKELFRKEQPPALPVDPQHIQSLGNKEGNKESEVNAGKK
jgi:tRNA pseudouridine38-40 synthase